MRTKVIAAVAEYLQMPAAAIDEAARFKEDYGCDSIRFIQLLFWLEDAFDMTFDTAAAYGFCLVSDVADYVVNYGKAAV